MGAVKEAFLNNIPGWKKAETSVDEYDQEWPEDAPLTDEQRQAME